jgi:hypothetical protein
MTKSEELEKVRRQAGIIVPNNRFSLLMKTRRMTEQARRNGYKYAFTVDYVTPNVEVGWKHRSSVLFAPAIINGGPAIACRPSYSEYVDNGRTPIIWINTAHSEHITYFATDRVVLELIAEMVVKLNSQFSNNTLTIEDVWERYPSK